MRNTYLFAALLLLFSLSLASQEKLRLEDYEPDWNETYECDGIILNLKSYGFYDEHYYVVSQSKKKAVLSKHNMDHELVDSRKLDLRFDGKQAGFDGFIKTKTRSLAYASLYDKKTKTFQLLVGDFEDDNLGKLQEVYSYQHQYKTIFSWKGSPFFSTPGSTLHKSPSGEAIACVQTGEIKKQSKEMVVRISVFDSEIKQLWNKQINLPIARERLRMKQIFVEDDGTVYLVGVARVAKVDQIRIWRVTQSELEELELNVLNSVVLNSRIVPDRTGKNKFFIAGVFKQGTKEKKLESYSPEGMFTVAMSHNGHLQEYKTELIMDGESIAKDLYINDLINFSDGTWGFVGEIFSTVTLYRSDGRSNPSPLYVSGKLLVCVFDQEGNYVYNKWINKEYESQYRISDSYALAISEDKMYFVYCDRKTKKEIEDLEGKKKWRYMDLVILDHKGNTLLEEVLFTSKDIELGFEPALCLSNSDYLMIGTRSGLPAKYSFGTIRLKN